MCFRLYVTGRMLMRITASIHTSLLTKIKASEYLLMKGTETSPSRVFARHARLFPVTSIFSFAKCVVILALFLILVL